MLKLFVKFILYTVLLLLMLEVLVRVFHLHNDMPTRYIAEEGVYKWMPGQEGYTVYGNRRQNFSEYHINDSGYNSYREFRPTKNGKEVAIIGDSYVEGFHQDYFRSIGKKVEEKMEGLQVYEYGHSSNDFADQLYLIHQNKETFDLIEHIIIGVKYENDFTRPEYKFIERKPFFPALRHSKLIVYLLSIGFVDPIKELHQRARSFQGLGFSKTENTTDSPKKKPRINKDSLYLNNFKSLVSKYGFDKKKTTLLLDSRITNKDFMNYLSEANIDFIDYSKSFKNAGDRPTTLIYDQHWNDFGRTLVAEEIVNLLSEKGFTRK